MKVAAARRRITELRTYMTGELFALLRQYGTLASAMQTAGANDEPGMKHDSVADDPEFLRGVAHAAQGPVLTHARRSAPASSPARWRRARRRPTSAGC